MKKININGIEIEYTDDNKSILNAILEHKIDVKADCKDGFCGTCRCELVKGKVKTSDNAIGFTKDNEILICSSIPLTDIEIKQS